MLPSHQAARLPVPGDLNTDLHFTCFVQAPEESAREAEIATGERCLTELDGRRAGPVDRGKSTDLLTVRTPYPGLFEGLMEYVGVCKRASRFQGATFGV